MELRPIQKEAVDLSIRAFKSGGTYHLLEAPVAFGKTIFASSLMSRAVHEFGAKCLFLAHLKELVEQTVDKLSLVDSRLSVGVFMGSRKEDGDVIVGTRQTVGKNLDKLGLINLLIIDEVHLYGPQYQKIVDHFLALNDRLRVLGVTGTPYTLKQGWIYGDGKRWTDPIYSTSMQKMIDMGYLSGFRYKLAESMEDDLRSVGKVAGEFNESQLGELMQEEHHMGTVKHVIEEYADDRKSIIVFAVTIEHAEKLAQFLGCQAVHSKLNKDDWRKRVDDFKSGNDRILVNVSQLSIGFDSPGIDCVIVARPTMSPALHVQICGRGLRVCDGKTDCLILDLVGNYLRHGLPTNPKVRRPKEQKETNTKSEKSNVCPECLEVVPFGLLECNYCGAEMTMRKEIIDRDERLKMMEIEAERKRPRVERFGEKDGHVTRNGSAGSLFWVKLTNREKPLFRFCGYGTDKITATRDQIQSLNRGDVVDIKYTAYGEWIA